MRSILFVITLVILSVGALKAEVISVRDNIKELNSLNPEQLEVLEMVYDSSQLFDLGYTAVGIIWQESKFGKWKINLADPSCGYFHKLLPEYARELGLKPTRWNNSRVCELLLDFDTSLDVFISTMRTKEQICRVRGSSNVWRCSIKGYNGSGKRAEEYMLNVINKIKAFKKWRYQ